LSAEAKAAAQVLLVDREFSPADEPLFGRAEPLPEPHPAAAACTYLAGSSHPSRKQCERWQPHTARRRGNRRVVVQQGMTIEAAKRADPFGKGGGLLDT
jgi:hypothetical protein